MEVVLEFYSKFWEKDGYERPAETEGYLIEWPDNYFPERGMVLSDKLIKSLGVDVECKLLWRIDYVAIDNFEGEAIFELHIIGE